MFAVPGWTYVSNLGNTDDDPGVELLMVNKSLGYFGIFDAISGALQQPFTAIKQGTGSIVPIDFDGDGKFELVITQDDGSSHRTFGVWHYVAGSYVPYFEHNSPIVTYSSAHFRSTTTLDLIEYRSTDILVRDIPTGTVVWQASVSFPGWNPVTPIASGVDLGVGGPEALLVTDRSTSIRAFKYNAGTFQPLWFRAGSWIPNQTFNSDTDPQSEVALIGGSSTLPGAALVLDGLTGASELDLSAFTGFVNVVGLDMDADGRAEIFVNQTDPNLVRTYKWNGAGYAQLFSHTDPIGSPSLVPLRSASQLDFLEQPAGDVRLRDLNGNVFFTASTALPGWGAGQLVTIPYDVDHDGIYELLILKGTKTWMVKNLGTMQPIWSLTGIVVSGFVGNTDTDPQDELLCADPVDNGYSLYDALTGTLAAHWPQYTIDNSAYDFGPWEQNGRNSLLFFRRPYLITPVPGPLPTRMYRWNGSGYSAAMVFEDSVVFTNGEQHRDATHWDLVEHCLNGDLLLRDAVAGNILFQASVSVPGWPGLDLNANPVTESIVFEPRGSRRTAVNDVAGMRMIARALSLDAPPPGQPGSVRLLPSTPNPFRNATTLRFESLRATKAALRIYDPAGRAVRSMDLALTAGLNTVAWDGMDDLGRAVPEGVFFYELRVDGSRESMKLVRLR